jgi:hypothetical protein
MLLTFVFYYVKVIGFFILAKNLTEGVMMKKIFILAGILVFGWSLSVWALDSADTSKDEKWSFPYTKEFSFFSGYAHGNLQEKGSYKIIPGIFRLGYNLDSLGIGFCDILQPVARKFNIKLKGFTEFLFEPYVNTVVSPDSNIEAGGDIAIKYSYPITKKIYLYALSGGGIGYTSQHTREQSTQWGFTPQIGTGFSYFFKKDTALSFEYRYRHFSNADIEEPNDGINVNMFLAGISYFY